MNLLGLKLLVFLWQALLILPLSFQKMIGQLIGLILKLSNLKRIRYGKINIENCLKGHDTKKIFNRNLKNFGYAIFETGFAWFWSDKKINKNINYEINGLDKLLDEQNKKQGVLLLFKHSLHLELDVRLLGINAEIYGVERKHDSINFNKIQEKGRTRSVKEVANKKDTLKFLKWLNSGKTVMYAPDQDYIEGNQILLNFFGMPCNQIDAPYRISKITKCKTFFLNSYKLNEKYLIEIDELKIEGVSKNKYLHLLIKHIEDKIKLHPDEYLWQHRRFKSTLGKKFYEDVK